MSACGAGCGYCGMCTAAWEREPSAFCDTCGEPLTDGAQHLTVGAFCGARCVDEFEGERAAETPAHLKGVGA